MNSPTTLSVMAGTALAFSAISLTIGLWRIYRASAERHTQMDAVQTGHRERLSAEWDPALIDSDLSSQELKIAQAAINVQVTVIATARVHERFEARRTMAFGPLRNAAILAAAATLLRSAALVV